MRQILASKAEELYSKLKDKLYVIPENYGGYYYIKGLGEISWYHLKQYSDKYFPLSRCEGTNPVIVRWGKMANKDSLGNIDKRYRCPTFEEFCLVYQLEVIVD